MSYSFSPKIVTDGLILCVDAKNVKSYTNGSPTWVDISTGINNGTLINGPTFDSINGSLTFDGINQYIDFGNNSKLQITVGTISLWMKATSGNNSFRGIIVKQNAWGLFLVDNVLASFDWGNYYATGFNIAFGLKSTGINLGNNTWTNVAMTFTQTLGSPLPGPPLNNVIVYVNGSPVLTTTILNQDQLNPLQIAYGNFPGQYFVGSIAQGIVYNRVLSVNEILQNYNALKTRFGL